jgi:hypothetical protein
MVTWRDFQAAVPEFAAAVEARLRPYRHHTMATIRRDGAPRISGTEIEITDEHLVLGMMLGTRRAADLRRDPRLAVHGHSVDPPEGDDAAWVGEVKVAGRAVELRPPEGAEGAEAQHDSFAIDIAEVVVTRIGDPADHLVIERWTPDGGLVTTPRY